MRYLSGVMLLSLLGVLQAEEFDAKVIAVMDGDTLMVLRDGKKVKIRLSNIDAPESGQEFGKESRDSLVNMVMKKQVHVNSRAVDSYGRLIAEISLDGKSVNEAQVKKGMAWERSHYHSSKRYLSLNKQAQQARLGLWAADVQPISPEQWRKTHLAKSNLAQPQARQSQARKTDSFVQGNTACGRKHLCSQMASCVEAKIYFTQCNVKSLDGNGDGVPCENLCAN